MSTLKLAYHKPSYLFPLNMKNFCLGTMNGGHVALHHETKYISVDICIYIMFECDFFPFRNNLVQRILNLFANQYIK